MTLMQHIPDAALLARAEGELTLGREAQEHLASCAECRARGESLRKSAMRVAALIDPVEPPDAAVARVRAAMHDALAGRRVPRRHSRARVHSPLAWAAAAAVVVSVGALAAPAVRRLVSPAPSEAPRPAPRPGATGASRDDAAENRVAFAVQGSVLRVRFSSVPAPGSVSLAATYWDHAMLITRGGDVEALLLPGELQVVNTVAPRARFEIAVPVTVRHVEVRAGGNDALLYRGAVPVAGPLVLGDP